MKLAGPLLALAWTGCSAAQSDASSPRAQPPADAPEFRLTMFDVGTGLSLLVTGADFTMLYDAGSNDDRKLGPDSRVLAYLALALGPSSEPECGAAAEAEGPARALDHFFVSHPHRDHLSAGVDVLRCREVKHVWQSGKQVDTEVFASFVQAARAEPGVELHEPPAFGAGSIIELGAGARATVLSVRPDASDTNDASIVLRLDLGAIRVLLTGDATAGKRRAPGEPPDAGSVEAELVEKRAGDLAADVLVVGHHGSKTSTRAAFLDAVSPRFALISSGPQKYGSVVLPDPEIVGLLEQRSIIVLRTDEDDDACRAAADKVGPDADGSPGGCSAKTLRLGSTVEVAPSPTKD